MNEEYKTREPRESEKEKKQKMYCKKCGAEYNEYPSKNKGLCMWCSLEQSARRAKARNG